MKDRPHDEAMAEAYRKRPAEAVGGSAAPEAAPEWTPPAGIFARNAIPSLAQMEAAHIEAVLAHMDGNKSRAARALGISREGLRVKLQKNDQHEDSA